MRTISPRAAAVRALDRGVRFAASGTYLDLVDDPGPAGAPDGYWVLVAYEPKVLGLGSGWDIAGPFVSAEAAARAEVALRDPLACLAMVSGVEP